MEGRFPEDKETLRKGSFDEKLSIIGLLSDKLMEEFRDYAQDEAVQKELFEIIKAAGNALGNDTDSMREYLENTASSMEKETEDQLSIGMISREDERIKRLTVSYLRELAEKTSLPDGDQFEEAKRWFKEREDARQARIVETGKHLTNSFEFLEQTFGDKESLSGSQEMVIFLTELSSAYHSLKFVRETGNDAYYKYNKLLLLNDRKQELKDIVKEFVL